MGQSFLQLRPAKIEEVTPAAQAEVLAAFLPMGKWNWWQAFFGKRRAHLSLELTSFEQKTRFYLAASEDLSGYFSSQLLSHYPRTVVVDSSDPLRTVAAASTYAAGWLTLTQPYALPLKTFRRDEVSPFAGVLGYLGKLSFGQVAHVQMVLRVPNQHALERRVRASMRTTDSAGVEHVSEYHSLLQQKLAAPFVEAQVRLLVGAENDVVARRLLSELAGAFGAYTMAEGNSLMFREATSWGRDRLTRAIMERRFGFGIPTLRLNLDEAASLWHLPNSGMAGIANIDWGRVFLSEAPDNLPVTEGLDEDAKRDINFFGKTEWRNRESVFGIKRDDRGKHVYIMGKTGAGKSTLIANMAINDIRNGEGVAVIDPHGDLSEMILEYIPKRRVADVVYLDPTIGGDRSFSLNLFDSSGAAHTDVVASGIVSVFYKLYAHSWGPRLEYILRNTVLTLLYYREATFADIPRLLTNRDYRNKVVNTIAETDPALAEFWRGEFDSMNEKLRVEAISPVLNKVGQFLSSQRIRHIVGAQKSTFSLEEIMSKKKILILNLSQGKLGEDTTALLGAMFITKMQLTAMARVEQQAEERQDFYLYVDEFQNFATTSFIKILSEARKYRLNLILANQYIDQVDEEIQRAIFGNVGTLLTFVVGAKDALVLEREFGGVFSSDDLVALGKFQTILKMNINGLTSSPFVAKTLPLPAVVNAQKESIVRQTLERYYRKNG